MASQLRSEAQGRRPPLSRGRYFKAPNERTPAARGSSTVDASWRRCRSRSRGSPSEVRPMPMSGYGSRLRIQVEGRECGTGSLRAAAGRPGIWSCRCCPTPSAGDVFFDLEGDPFAGDGGLEYLFGYAFFGADGAIELTLPIGFFRERTRKRRSSASSISSQSGLSSFRTCTSITSRPMNPAALKRLMGRYATREEALDRLLRSQALRRSLQCGASWLARERGELFDQEA